MGRKQKLKLERRIEEREEAVIKKEKRKKMITKIILAAVLVFALYQVNIAMKNNKNAENNSARENKVSNESQENSAQNTELTEEDSVQDIEILDESSQEVSDQEPKDDNKLEESEEIANKIVMIETSKGNIKLELFTNDAPKTVENFVKLSGDNFYDGVKFHRVDQIFMIQGGDPLSKDSDPKNDGTGGPGYSFEDEINPWNLGLDENTIKLYESRGYQYNKNLTSHKVEVGSLAMANSGPNTNGSQFFIVTEKAQPHLDGLHTVFGKVAEGMDVVRRIGQGDIINDIKILTN